MLSKKLVNDFVSQTAIAITGVSRENNKFGNMAFRELTAKGYTLYPIHPQAETLEGVKAFKDYSSLPEKVDGLLISVSPKQTLKVVQEAASAGIKIIWMQQGSESKDAIDFCRLKGIDVIYGECIMMYAVGSGIHGFHRWLWKLLGKAPK